MNKEKKVIDPNNKDALLKAKDERILELEAEVEALKKLKALVLQRNKQQIKKNNSCHRTKAQVSSKNTVQGT